MKFFEEAKVFKKHMTIISSISLGICLFDLSLLICQSMLISLTDRKIKCGDRWTNWENISTILNILAGKEKKKSAIKHYLDTLMTCSQSWQSCFQIGRSVYTRSLWLCLASLIVLFWTERHLSKIIFCLKFQSNVLKHWFLHIVLLLGIIWYISSIHDCLWLENPRAVEQAGKRFRSALKTCEDAWFPMGFFFPVRPFRLSVWSQWEWWSTK